MITVGVLTRNRPEMCERALKALVKTYSIDRLYVHDDGSDAKYAGAYRRAWRAAPGAVFQLDRVNRGVAAGKNALLSAMLADGADWMILCEDDITPISPLAVDGYVYAAESVGVGHLSFAHHGPGNVRGPVDVDGQVAYFPHAIGAWCLYSRHALEAVGLFDENFTNAFEHVEHSLRVALAGFGGGPFRWPDAAASASWLREQRGAIEKSVIRPRPDWQVNIVNGLAYWRDRKPDTYKLMFGEGAHLHAWAQYQLEGAVA